MFQRTMSFPALVSKPIPKFREQNATVTSQSGYAPTTNHQLWHGIGWVVVGADTDCQIQVRGNSAPWVRLCRSIRADKHYKHAGGHSIKSIQQPP